MNFESMTINERIFYLRKNVLHITQTELGKVCGVGDTAVSKMEKNGSTITERNIDLICKEFNVNVLWLKEGIGEIMSELPRDLFEELAKEYNLNDTEKKLVKTFLELDDHSRDILLGYLKKVFVEE